MICNKCPYTSNCVMYDDISRKTKSIYEIENPNYNIFKNKKEN